MDPEASVASGKSLTAFPNEILCNILKVLVQQSLPRFDIRLVSKQICEIATPLVYNEIRLTGRKLEFIVRHIKTTRPMEPNFGHSSCANSLENVVKYAEILNCSWELDRCKRQIEFMLTELAFIRLRTIM